MKWVHIACNNINTYTYQKLQNCKAPWYCKSYIKKSIPFSEVTNDTFKKIFKAKIQFSPNLKNYFSDDETQVSEKFGKTIQNKTFTPEELNQYFSADGKESL